MPTFKFVVAVFVTLALATACVSRPTATTTVGALALASASRYAVAPHGMVVSATAASRIASDRSKRHQAEPGRALGVHQKRPALHRWRAHSSTRSWTHPRPHPRPRARRLLPRRNCAAPRRGNAA